ncbi:MAG: sulfurtransferase TusA family protein [Atopobiaceae bacterium]|nr:sulfurtransferase TusA family protein [Atopobiaceae bacterium]MBQ3282877.1 sulfurtransferase TusA family protein [Atopobiaceae bacterium]MBQ6411252.1 sulfurtransferase TusA family protein [Atopobiaceae bacterium]MBQ6650527.1 sulfurtransferase TusA family protein [Atopobiaceae bacterium]
MQTIDARGLSCPEPAMMMYEALDEFPNEPFKFLVSSATSKVNVTEAATRKKREVSVERDGDDFVITVK